MTQRAMIEDCCGWNKKIWADAVEFAVGTLPNDLRGRNVIEIGASEKSTLAPIFAAKGASVICSYYSKTPGFKARPQPGGDIKTIEANVMELTGHYDVIVMKSVLGGVFKNDDYEGIGKLIRKLVRNNLKLGGVIITIDNGYIGHFHKLRKARGTGGNRWTYLKQNKLGGVLEEMNGYVTIRGFGYLNVASAWLQFERSRFGRKLEFVNTIVYYVDKAIIKVFSPFERAVLATVIRR